MDSYDDYVEFQPVPQYGSPRRIQAAFEFLAYCRFVEEGSSYGPSDPGDMPSAGGRDLHIEEQCTKNLALRAISQYLSGEMDFGDCPPNSQKRAEKAKKPSLDTVKEPPE